MVKTMIKPSCAKTIYLVQHTQSVHHTNGHVGAWGDWDLTELGREQAFAVGQYLQREGVGEGYVMYTSDLKRAAQTAEGINRTLGLTPIVTPVIREVNAGQGNGKIWEWYAANRYPFSEGFHPDYRPFDDAESDRDVWKRLYPFYREILANDADKILIVSHGTALSFFQSMLVGQELEDRGLFRFKGPGGSISKFRIGADGSVMVAYINRLAY